MDERQTQVVSGAGLQESRINTEFVDFLSKWGPRVLYILLAIVLAFLGYQRWTKYQTSQRDQAFADYEAQVASMNPDLLLSVAEKHANQPAVWSLAMRDAANLIMQSATTGIAPGADPLAPKPEDALSTDQRSSMFKQAETIYRDIIAKNKNVEGQLIFAEQARWGLASSLMSQGKPEAGEQMLEEFIAAASDGDLPDLAGLGRNRLQSIRTEGAPPEIVPESSLPPGAIRAGLNATNLTPSTTGSFTDPNTGVTTTRIPTPPPPTTEDSPLPETDEPADDPSSPESE